MMAWEYDDQYIAAGVTADPRDLGANVQRYAAEMAGHLDRDNVPDTAPIAQARWAVKAIMATGSNPVGGAGASIQTIATGQTGTWVTITPMTTTIDTDEGTLKVAMDVEWEWGALGQLYNDRLEVRLLIDGRVVSETGWSSIARTYEGASLTGYAIVDSTSVSVTVQMRIYAAPYRHIEDITNGVNVATNTADNSPAARGPTYIMAGNIVWEQRKR